MRKYLIAAVAALAASGLTAVSTSGPDRLRHLTLSTKHGHAEERGHEERPKPHGSSCSSSRQRQQDRTMSDARHLLPEGREAQQQGPAGVRPHQAATRVPERRPRARQGRRRCGERGPRRRTARTRARYLRRHRLTRRRARPARTATLPPRAERGGNVETAPPETTIKKASGKYGTRISNLKVPDGSGEYGQFPNIYNGAGRVLGPEDQQLGQEEAARTCSSPPRAARQEAPVQDRRCVTRTTRSPPRAKRTESTSTSKAAPSSHRATARPSDRRPRRWRGLRRS